MFVHSSSFCHEPTGIGRGLPHHIYLDEVYEHWSAANLSGRNPNYVEVNNSREIDEAQIVRSAVSAAVVRLQGANPRRKCPAQCFSRASRRVDPTWAPQAGWSCSDSYGASSVALARALCRGAGGTSGYLSSIRTTRLLFFFLLSILYYTLIPKGPSRSPLSLRPITVLPFPYRVYASLRCQTLLQWQTRCIHPSQYAFCKVCAKEKVRSG